MLVLWLVVVLGAVAIGVVTATRAEANLALNLRARASARYAAESGVTAGKALLQNVLSTDAGVSNRTQALRDLSDTFRDLEDVKLGGVRFAVGAEDLSARLDLNTASDQVLAAFFRQFTRPEEAERLAAAVADWRDYDDRVHPGGAEAEDYRRAGLAQRPSNRPFGDLSELRLVMGMTPGLAAAIAPYVTVDGDQWINLNSAPESVLVTLPGLGPDGARALVSRREGAVIPSVMSVASLFRETAAAPLPIAMMVVEPSRIAVVSRGWVDGYPLTHEIRAIYQLSGRTVVLRGWSERDR
jgi:general secretion pathway protein K